MFLGDAYGMFDLMAWIRKEQLKEQKELEKKLKNKNVVPEQNTFVSGLSEQSQQGLTTVLC